LRFQFKCLSNATISVSGVRPVVGKPLPDYPIALRRGASPYDVAKILGDSIDTVEKHYSPFVRELRERVRSILENGLGLEEIGKLAPEFVRNTEKKLN
jgi:hypothetical protein